VKVKLDGRCQRVRVSVYIHESSCRHASDQER